MEHKKQIVFTRNEKNEVIQSYVEIPIYKVISRETKEVLGYANEFYKLEILVFWSGYYIHELDVAFGSICKESNRCIYTPDKIEEDLPLGSYLEKYDKPMLSWIIAMDQQQKERFGYNDKGKFYQDLATMKIIEIH